MLESRKGGRFGRLQPRPVATGLLSSVHLTNGKALVQWTREFREPRHIKRHLEGGYLLTEINRLLFVDEEGQVRDFYHHPFFSFLHTVDLSPDHQRALVTSAGFDSVIELDLTTHAETLSWFAWDHGFNPDNDGVWLTANRDIYGRYRSEGKEALLIDPSEYGEQGLVTARRSAHPNVAVYDPYTQHEEFIISIGHNGALYRYSRKSNETTRVLELGDQMPHGLMAYSGGWAITNTVRGEWQVLDQQFQPNAIYSVASLGHKVEGTENVEWVQQVVPVDESRLLFIDANRGLIAVDRQHHTYSVYHHDPNWCIQDALPLSS